ncbi:uncharacterized protein LOC114246793 [Bombyx mandarina]|uniref:Uncharacterized protein LOC114246793 n=1 Tax=Bombyx mandarina TaxID=7092 RepID=A0A6J2K0T3_BOMMA|nr:uncharacterized protein LOC114246793 [Bombyx mandarina]XP_028035289.1 uncharacterized protein LOC114246793 [Bombyx mandarina]
MTEQYLIAVVLIILSLTNTGVQSLQCYQCLINPPLGYYYNNTNRLCVHFDHSDKFIVECPYSTMCMKQEFHLDIQNGVRIKGILRDCAPQKYDYQEYKNGVWSPKTEVMEPYKVGCQDIDDKGQRTTPTRYCYCRSNLCNSSPSVTHEGYTDIMGFIVVFNLMKYINSLR